MRSSSSFRRWVSALKMVRFKYRRLLTVCICLISFTALHYTLYQQPSYEDRMQKSTLKILNAIDKNTSSVVLPDESTVYIQPIKTCKGTGGDHFLLFLFITSPENVDRRDVIRQLFAKRTEEWESSIARHVKGHPAGESIKFLFFIGLPKDEIAKERLKEEWQSHGDIILEDLKESYLNLTLKTLRMLKWVNSNCPDVRYLAKIDDDVHLNMPKFLRFLYQYDNTTGRNLIAGHKYPTMARVEDPSSKWFTPNILWPGLFPEFVGGFFYVLGSQAKTELYTHALKTPMFHLEDVYITGIVRSKHTNLTVIDIPGMWQYWPYLYDIYSPCGGDKEFVAIHPLSGGRINCWGQFSTESFKCTHWPIFTYCLFL